MKTVYAVRIGKYVKIGITIDVTRRMKEMRRLAAGYRGKHLLCRYPPDLTGPVELLATMTGSETVEHALQAAFADVHVLGEWFEWGPRMQAWAASQTTRDGFPPVAWVGPVDF